MRLLPQLKEVEGMTATKIAKKTVTSRAIFRRESCESTKLARGIRSSDEKETNYIFHVTQRKEEVAKNEKEGEWGKKFRGKKFQTRPQRARSVRKGAGNRRGKGAQRKREEINTRAAIHPMPRVRDFKSARKDWGRLK